jgi:hypothetical protein
MRFLTLFPKRNSMKLSSKMVIALLTSSVLALIGTIFFFRHDRRIRAADRLLE